MTLNTKSTKPVLIPTESKKYPFVIKLQDSRGIDEYWLINTEGILTGDGFSTSEKDRYPEFLKNI